MVDLDWKTKMVSSDISSKSPRLSNKLQISIPTPAVRVADLSPASESACAAYENYLRLPELRKLWSSRDFPGWKSESFIKPALQGLEITFRFISTVLSDPRPYVNCREWKRRLESLAVAQVEIIAMLCEDAEDDAGAAPIVDMASSSGALMRNSSSVEVWKHAGVSTVVSRVSEASLLPRLATWQKSEDVAEKILYSIECQMRRCRYTLGVGEPNLAGKPCLDYDKLCDPAQLHALKKSPSENMNLGNSENQTLYTAHQILESWTYAAGQLLIRIEDQIHQKNFENASANSWVLEKIWKLLTQIEDLHLLMDPNDFLRLKNQLSIKTTPESDLFCFRSKGLVEVTRVSKDLRHKVPEILEVEVDPKGGPRIQDAAMELYQRSSGGGAYDRVHLLQALQAVEMAVKSFYFAYKQLLVVVMGSVEVNGNRALMSLDNGDALTQIFLQPTYFPSLDAAKTFLGQHWAHEVRCFSPDRQSK